MTQPHLSGPQVFPDLHLTLDPVPYMLLRQLAKIVGSSEEGLAHHLLMEALEAHAEALTAILKTSALPEDARSAQEFEHLLNPEEQIPTDPPIPTIDHASDSEDFSLPPASRPSDFLEFHGHEPPTTRQPPATPPEKSE